MKNLSEHKLPLERSEHLADVEGRVLEITDFMFGESSFGDYVKFVCYDEAGDRHEVITSAMVVLKTFREIHLDELPLSAIFRKGPKYWDIDPVGENSSSSD